MKALNVLAIGAACVLGTIDTAAAQTAVRVDGRVAVRVGPIDGRVTVRTPRRVEPVRRAPRHVDRSAAYRYCEVGHGHPRNGWAWCVDGGYVAPFVGRDRFNATYDRFRLHEPRRHYRDSRLDERELVGLLGRERVRQLERSLPHGRHGRPALHGEMVRDGRVRSIIVRTGRHALAEYRDHDGDGVIDVTFRFPNTW